MKRKLLTWAVGLLLSGLAARPATAQTRRMVDDWQLWTEPQGELAINPKSYLLAALQGQFEFYNRSSYAGSRELGFDARRYTIGYERFWKTDWSWGVTGRMLSNEGFRVFVPEALLRHRSHVGPLVFGQRLSLERQFYYIRVDNSLVDAPASENWVRLRLDLEKQLPLGHLTLRPRLSYEAATHLRLQKGEFDEDERTIQFTRLRGEVGIRLNSWFDFTPWVAYQTNYLTTVPQYDGNGNQTSGGQLNIVTTLVGLEARFTLLGGVFKRAADGAETMQTEYLEQQLPTQH